MADDGELDRLIDDAMHRGDSAEAPVPDPPAAAPKGKKGKKRKAPDVAEPPAEPARLPFASDLDAKERAETWAMLQKYQDAFPDAVRLPACLGEDSSAAELKLQLAKAQKRVSQHHEVGMLRSGLVAACGTLEVASSFIPNRPIKLQGFASNVNSCIEQFDGVLKELAIKHLGTTGFSAEQTLLMLLGRVVLQTHLANAKEESKQRRAEPVVVEIKEEPVQVAPAVPVETGQDAVV